MKPLEYINRVLNEASTTLVDDDTIDESSADFFRGISDPELSMWLKGTPLPSTDLMPFDPEVVEYGMGDAYDSDDNEAIENWIKAVCPWYDGSHKSVKGGLNVTSDFDNAKGYGNYVLGLNSKTGNIADFSEHHHLFKNVKDAELIFVYNVKTRKFKIPK